MEGGTWGHSTCSSAVSRGGCPLESQPGCYGATWTRSIAYSNWQPLPGVQAKVLPAPSGGAARNQTQEGLLQAEGQKRVSSPDQEDAVQPPPPPVSPDGLPDIQQARQGQKPAGVLIRTHFLQ